MTRRGESTALRFVAYGVRVAVVSDRRATLEAATPFLPPGRAPLAGGRVQRTFRLATTVQADGSIEHALHAGRRPLARSGDLDRVLGSLEWETNLFLARRAPGRIFVHAGAVGWKGRAILVPGSSWTGKSTLVAALVEAGCSYLSDEYAVLDPDGRCHAFPRPLSLRTPDGVERRRPETLGGAPPHAAGVALPVGRIVLTRYLAGARWQPSRPSEGAAVLALLQNTVVARARASEALATLRAAVGAAETLEGPRGEAAETVPALLAD